MQEISIFDCPGCRQRYIMRVIEHDQFVTGESMCACGAKLGSWHGLTSLEFSPLDLERA